MKEEVRRVLGENFGAYGTRKVWRQMKQKGFNIARCTAARLMKSMDLEGVVRSKSVKITIGNKASSCPLNRVNQRRRTPARSTSGSGLTGWENTMREMNDLIYILVVVAVVAIICRNFA